MTTPGTRAATGVAPLDIATMRVSVAQVLPPEVTPAGGGVLETLTGILRGHLQLLVPEIEEIAARLPADCVPRYCALVCVKEARRKLNARPGLGPYDAVVYVRRLGRSLLALCEHYESLTGVRMCLACGRPVRDGGNSLPYGKVSPSGGVAVAGQVHE